MEAINSKRTGVCRWIESGTTIDTALPELSECVDGKKEWRAIIVRVIDESSMKEFESDKRNPFDFTVDSKCGSEYDESSMPPLVRLTQMLGGVPKPETEFDSFLVKDRNQKEHMLYRVTSKPEDNEEYVSLCKKYEFDGKLPESIVIVSVRKNYSGQNQDVINKSHSEINSSQFWKKNHYADKTRFLVYDFKKEGKNKRIEDEFGFWLSILMIASNEPDSGTLQAYRLYTIKPVYDKNLMSYEFQRMADNLISAKRVLKNDLQNSEKQLVFEEKDLPDYKIEIPVMINHTNKRKKAKNRVNLFGRNQISEYSNWNEVMKRTKAELDSEITLAERQLDKAAESVRFQCTFNESEVSGLSRYQREDLIKDTELLYSEIVNLQGKLPSNGFYQDEKTASIVKSINKQLRSRIHGNAAAYSLLIAASLICISMIPAVIIAIMNKPLILPAIGIIAAIEFAVVAGFALAAAVIKKSKLQGLYDDYRKAMQTCANAISNSAEDYGKYLSRIASYSRGHSYLNLSLLKKSKTEEIRKARINYIDHIDKMLEKLKLWANAHFLDIDYNNHLPDEYRIENIGIPPSENYLFTFETGNSYPVMVNRVGEIMESPFSFVKGIEISREELYDD